MSAFDFTELYKTSASLVCFSPGTHFLLAAVNDRLIVRRTESFQIVRTWLPDWSASPTSAILANAGPSKPKATASDGWISHIGWSCDSEYIMVACQKRGVVHVLKLRDETWSARIDAGAEGLVKAEWAPDGRSILCFSQCGLRITIWSLVTGTSNYIQFPVHPDRGYAFRADGRYLVVAERHKSKDTLGLYDAAESYKLARHFPLPTSSLSSLALSPTGNHLAVWEGALQFKVTILSLAGTVLASFTPPMDPGFGVRHAVWHPSGNFLAVNGWEDKIHILDQLSWSSVSILELSSHVPTGTTMWREPSKWLETTEGRGFLSFERLEGPQTISISRQTASKALPKLGTLQLEWNKTGSLLLARFESTPTAVHIFHFPSATEDFVPRLRTVLVQNQPVLHARWNPIRSGNLALCCGNGSMYTWSDEWVSESGEEEEMAECIGVPAKTFETRDLKWSPDGKAIILIDKDTFCCAFEVEATS
ncbi:WD repeat-containing protein 8 [Mycena floridula]|nr:WD repeat-containing protein 8 [Mycena floridula]